MIQQRKLLPGDVLPSEIVLIAELGVSRLILREGLAKLGALEIIQVQQGKGSFVSESINPNSLEDVFLPIFFHSDDEQFDELLEARIVLEKAMAKKATAHRTEAQRSGRREIGFHHPSSVARLVPQLERRPEEIDIQSDQTIQASKNLCGQNAFKAQMTYKSPDHSSVLLLNPGLVVLQVCL
jgi:GntR family transcriptional repressor for pyruvate dehydrogenase complex